MSKCKFMNYDGSSQDVFDLAVLFAEDLAQVLALENACYDYPWTAENFLGEFRRNISLALGLKQNGRLVAHCFFWLMPPEIHLLNLAVSPDFRGQGLARCLLANLKNVARRSDSECIFLEVRPSNEGAISLYTSEGFEFTGRRPDYYEDGEDAFLMTLDLKNSPSDSPLPDFPCL